MMARILAATAVATCFSSSAFAEGSVAPIGAEIGFQRSFTSTHIRIAEDSFVSDLELSYFHIGTGAGVRF